MVSGAGRTLLDKYRLEALVGIGGMGAVYRAHHPGLDRRVALKILQPNVALGDERVIELFEREARTSSQICATRISPRRWTPDTLAAIWPTSRWSGWKAARSKRS
ncbi:MAG: hypothetical protein ACREAB_02795 [Blastocatellia bacterium]